MDLSIGQERRAPVTPSSSSRYHRRRSSGARDERYRSDVHTEAVQAALAKHKERKMAVPMPSKRRSLVVQTSMDAYTPPDTSSCSEGEGQGEGGEEEGGHGEEEDRGGDGGTISSQEGSISMGHWISRAIHGTSSTTTTTTSSTASSSSSSTHSGGSGPAGSKMADVLAQHVQITSQRFPRHHHHHHRHKTGQRSQFCGVEVCSATNRFVISEVAAESGVCPSDSCPPPIKLLRRVAEGRKSLLFTMCHQA
eukprot:XP_011618741.1 PREDICTED: disco-interacting protein 2 homolog C-like [Takifugu rubripes]